MISRITTRPLITVVLSLVLGAAPVYAQRATDVPELDSKDSQKSQAAAKPDAPPTDPAPAPATRNDSPFDYRSSEEISEDLSVSFPVDI